MNFPISIGRTSLSQILGVLGGIFQFHSSSNRTFSEPDQTPRSAASDLGLRCLSMSHKRTLGLYGLIY